MKQMLFFILAITMLANGIHAQTLRVFDARPLTLTVINAPDSGFGVNSILVSGKTDAILVNAQFTKSNALKVVEVLKASGKTLKQIYISYEDPDYYFGLAWIKSAFPDVLVTAKPSIIEHIKATQQNKLDTWGAIFKDQMPTNVILPQVQKSDTLWVENTPMLIKNTTADTKKGTYIWIPSSKVLFGGNAIVGHKHVFTADDQTKEKREKRIAILEDMLKLKPQIVIPGHMTANAACDTSAILFTQKYLQDFDVELAKYKKSADLIKVMDARYPNLEGKTSLELGAKVNTGEMKW
ncbi:MBL fold metallo-hydrolase [Pedobacter sp. AW1-32]|uniref:MBL fold metallo-hydrolase n=1 Tax=Pedobacter sp. AW1-32 TaxID=3383026 RepID=UPI003FEEF47B